jgi:sialate O-acetylesterase
MLMVPWSGTARVAFAFLLAMSAYAPQFVQADVSLPRLFGNHMVLQAEQSGAPVWGKAAPGEKVTVTLGDQQATATAGDDGKWMARLATPKAGGPFELVIAGSDAAKTLRFSDVLVGEVWVASGQSNMEWTVAQSLRPQEEAENANFPQIRMFKVQHNAAHGGPQDDVTGSWVVCSPSTAAGFSACGYFFARELHRELKVPVGIVSTNWGGTLCEAWTSPAGLASDPDFAPILERYKVAVENQAKAAANPNPDPKAKRPGSLQGQPNHPSVLYNGMIHPVIPYAIRGAIWYQGESNLGRAEQYGKLFPAMITDWRKLWSQGDFPFYFAQIAPYAYNKMSDTKQLPELWEAQLKALALPNTGMAATTDVGDVKDIHPKNKQEVGRRLALWALAKTYGKTEVVCQQPRYASMKVEGNKIRIQLQDTAGGLMTQDNAPLNHFTIAGADHKFVEAQATIEGDAVVVSSDQVTQPVAVRFGWSDTAEPNLFGKTGLPVCPFRTDTLPNVTAGRK